MSQIKRTESKNSMGSDKIRLDDLLVKRGLFENKSQAQAAIMAGGVKINGKTSLKAGTRFADMEELEIETKNLPFVSRGGFKLEKAAREFQIELKGRICLDCGASTGGFTDYLLQNGAEKVYAIDVGYGQLAWKLRNDPRVITLERINIRYATIEEIYKDLKVKDPQLFADIAVIDLSFISLEKVLANIIKLMKLENIEIIALIKPQFEAGKEEVPKSGVIKDKKIHFKVIKNVVKYACELGLYPKKLTYSPIKGPAGNIEYLIHLTDRHSKLEDEAITEVVEEANGKLSSG